MPTGLEEEAGLVPPVEVPEEAVPTLVAEEEKLLGIVLSRLDNAQRRHKVAVDDAAALIELRDALVEAKPEDQGSLLEQMHRIEAIARQRGKGESTPINRDSPYFGHLRLAENGRRRDVLIGARSYVEPGGGVQIVDWRHAPVSRLFYRYDEGDAYEEDFGDRTVEGQVTARRTVTIQHGELRRVSAPQGTFARDPESGVWRARGASTVRLGVGLDPRESTVPAAAARRGQISLGHDSDRRADRHLPAIAALIDPRQFELITRPSAGIIAVQGSAGSGKTTIGLHRIAYLAFAEAHRFTADKMLVIVYQRALARYVSRVLPSLDVPDVPVLTFAGWAAGVREKSLPTLAQAPVTDAAPPLVMRAKAHPALLRMLTERSADLAARCRDDLTAALAGRPRAHEVLEAFDASRGPIHRRLKALLPWLESADLERGAYIAAEAAVRRCLRTTRDVVGAWAALLTDRRALGDGFARHAPGLFSEGQLDDVHRWCVERERLRTAGPAAADEERDPWALDEEDEAILLRLHQLQKGPLKGPRGPLAYEHLMVDEVQDFSPIELAVLLDTTTAKRSVTLAGDTAQAIREQGFSDWSALLDELGIPHERIEPLRVSYRSTREIVDCAEHALGPLRANPPPVVPRSGSPVEAFGFASPGEAAEFLAQALRDLGARESSASVALIAPHPEQARLYFEALRDAEVPDVRLVDDQNFLFIPGIDVTDVRQVKGLEFDVVILLETGAASYPSSPDARRLLHVAMTRAAHQLWITWTGRPSPLLPPTLHG